MIRQNISRQWNFQQSKPSSKSMMVDLPHDFSITQNRDPNTLSGASNGFFPGGVAIYEKSLFIPHVWEGKNVILEFEGVYMNSTVRFNNQIISQHPYGYTSFHCDLTPYLMLGKDNTIQVTVNNSALPNTRWYSGSGIYRPVWLMVVESIHISPWGIYATMPVVSAETSTIATKTAIENTNSNDANILLRSTLLTACGEEKAVVDSKVAILAKSTLEVIQTLTLASTKLWSVETPYLYTLRSEIIKDGVIIDSSETKIGIRSISIDAENGFQLNGISMKLKGGCIHHDCGLVGSSAYDRAEERKVELLKASGFNAVRCAHNPPSPAFLDACDRLGMLVIDEAFDCWRESKNPNDYGYYFENWWQRDMMSMVVRDRNHPCIFMWSTGNEIPERDGRSNGYGYAKKLADFIRNLDKTRFITNALCGIPTDPMILSLIANMDVIPQKYDYWGELTCKFAEPLDVVGYNYLLDRYESDGKKFPGRIICGTETFPIQALENWDAVERLPYVIGDFVWTALDYLGEAGIGHVWYNGETNFLGNYPWHQAFCGNIDICGFKRPQSYFRDCVWGVSKTPYIAVYKPENWGKTAVISRWGWQDVVSSWTWPGYEGKKTIVEVYSSDDRVELYLNGKSLGQKPTGKANHYTASYEVTYESGELIAVSYQNGIESSRSTLITAGAPDTIRLTPDRSKLKAKFDDLSYITIELLDSFGNIVHNASNTLYFTVSGVGSLLAVGSGNPITDEMYVGNVRRVHEGRAMIVVRSNGEMGEIIICAMSEGIKSSSISLSVE